MDAKNSSDASNSRMSVIAGTSVRAWTQAVPSRNARNSRDAESWHFRMISIRNIRNSVSSEFRGRPSGAWLKAIVSSDGLA
jgi:hypothetical protein